MFLMTAKQADLEELSIAYAEAQPADTSGQIMSDTVSEFEGGTSFTLTVASPDTLPKFVEMITLDVKVPGVAKLKGTDTVAVVLGVKFFELIVGVLKPAALEAKVDITRLALMEFVKVAVQTPASPANTTGHSNALNVILGAFMVGFKSIVSFCPLLFNVALDR